MTMAYVVLIHLMLICPLIRALSIWMQADAQRRRVTTSSTRHQGSKWGRQEIAKDVATSS